MFLFNNRFGFDTEVYTGAYFSVGIHPWDAEQGFSFLELENLITHPHCLAIGECGLDKLKGAGIEIQKKIFLQQLELALRYQKPVLIHCVKAFDELVEFCKPYTAKVPLIIHGFNKSHQLAIQLIRQGFYLSLGSSVLNKKEVDLQLLPLETIFFETDTHNDLSIRDVYQQASLVFNIPEDELKAKIYSNFITLFKMYGR